MTPTFGRYELLKRLAGGGMGEVFLARQRGLHGFQKLLVLKTLLPHLSEDEELITMFKDEARVTAQLIHPNICQVFEFDQAAGVYYMAMEYLRGEDLRRLWRACESAGRRLPVPLVCRIVADAASGLDFAHGLRDAEGAPYQIVHRDISPQNVFVTFEGGVKIIDFGVAKAAGRAQHTRTGALKGKYGYMSPEQAAGLAVDNRSDVFALGVVLHELLTGRRLFKAESDVQTLARVCACEVPPPSELNPQLPPGLDPIVLRALRKDPGERFRTAQEFRLALEDWLVLGRMSASSAHLAEFLKVVYAERLDREARLGPLLGEAPLSASAPEVATPAEATPLATTQAPPLFRSRTAARISVLLGAALILAAAVVVLRPQVAPPSAPTRPAEVLATPALPPPEPPRVYSVRIVVEPEGTEIFEGDRRIGTSPASWSATPGTHGLAFVHPGYAKASASLVAARDGEEFRFKALRRLEPRRPARELGIKAER